MTLGPTFITLQEARRPGPFGGSSPLVNVRPVAQGQWTGWYYHTDVYPTIYDPHLWAPVRNAGGFVVDLRPRMRGAGDVVARATSAMGIQPCPPCEQRRQKLNRWFPFS